jgi:hypothetical protein
LGQVQLVASGDTTTIGEYQYYGDTRRAKKAVSNRGEPNTPNDGGDTTVLFYYGGVAAGAPAGRSSVVGPRDGSNQTTFQHRRGPANGRADLDREQWRRIIGLIPNGIKLGCK